jgi:hypothetical protein
MQMNSALHGEAKLQPDQQLPGHRAQRGEPLALPSGARYIYICEDGLVHYCSQQRGYPAKPLAEYTREDIRREYRTTKECPALHGGLRPPGGLHRQLAAPARPHAEAGTRGVGAVGVGAPRARPKIEAPNQAWSFVRLM